MAARARPSALIEAEAAELVELQGRVERLERRLAELDRAGRLPNNSLGSLTAREREVAELVASGLSNHQVARDLFISVKTVEWNLSKIYRKLRVSSRTELIVKLIRTLASGESPGEVKATAAAGFAWRPRD